MNLGALNSGDYGRLTRELDDLVSIGVKNLRIMASTQGPDDRARRIVPSLEYDKEQYNNDIWVGLDTFLDEMSKREMKAVLTLNNFWEWSGGFGQISEWYGNGFDRYPTRFYGNKELTDHLNRFIERIVNRVNSVNNRVYKEDPTIMAWQLANEPRAGDCSTWAAWVNDTSSYIKSLGAKQLVSIGNEGSITSCSHSGNNLPNIDYLTFHAWAQNWGWYSPRSRVGLDRGIQSVTNYINSNINMNKNYNKPIVMEEFGLARDQLSYDPSASVTLRNEYFEAIFKHIYTIASQEDTISGLNFWAWGGEGRPRENNGCWWKEGDDFTGDPPHERQGWYSVYDDDNTTKDLIKEYTEKFDELS